MSIEYPNINMNKNKYHNIGILIIKENIHDSDIFLENRNNY